MLNATGLTYRLANGRVLFADLRLDVAAGQTVAIEGPSGTGKSTLLAVLGGALDATAGSCQRPDRSEIAWVLQGSNCLPARRVIDNASLIARADAGSSRDARARAAHALGLVGLDSFVRQRARALSGGELQRLGVATALASNRRLILADEPTSHLDADNARLVMALLADYADRDHAVIVVTHDRAALDPRFHCLTLSPAGLTPADG